MRISAMGGRGRRLAQVALIPTTALALAACGYEDPANNTGDKSDPALFGETSNGIGFPHDVVTTEGIASAGLYLPIFLIAVAIFVLVEGLLLYSVLRFRKRSEGTDLPEQVHGSNKLEIIWTTIPMLIVFVLFLVSTMVLLDVESRSDEHGAVVEVEGFRYGWKFDYMDPTSFDTETDKYQPLAITVVGGGRDAAPQMTLPVGEPVLIRLSSLDVIHSFYVPSFFFKRDAIPGRTNEFEITIEVPGVYGGQCAEFCGLAHGDMFFSVNAIEAAEYHAWIAEQTDGATLTADVSEAKDEPAAAPTTDDAATADETSEEAA